MAGQARRLRRSVGGGYSNDGIALLVLGITKLGTQEIINEKLWLFAPPMYVRVSI